MSGEFGNSYFQVLPNELLIKILSDVDSLTLLNFCEVYQCDCFLQDKNVIKTIDLCRNYGVEDLSRISEKIDFELVTTLNINCLYWVQVSKLRKFIARLVNLETLYAIQTNLSLAPGDTEIYSRSKIKKLGVSVKRNDVLGHNKMPNIATLYVGVVHAKVLTSPLIIEHLFPNLEKVWVDVEEPCGREFFLFCMSGHTKCKIFCQVNAPIPSLNFEHLCLTRYYNNRRPCQPYVMCCERFDTTQMAGEGGPFELESGGWQILNELHYCKPYGPKDAHRLHLNHNKLDDMFFEELNFYHNGPVCNQRCREAIKEILRAPNAKEVKKLCIMMCLLENKNSRDSVHLEDTVSFKRKRRGVEKTTEAHPAEDMFRNFIDLEELGIFVCNQTSNHSAIQAYPLISLFGNLRSLIIEFPVTLDGSFLSEVLKKCRHIEILRITSVAQNEKLNFNLCNSISSASSMRDFRYENHRIHMDKLLERLTAIKSRKLERIVLLCKEVDKFSIRPLEHFLEGNPQLVFLYFLITECTVAAQRKAQHTLNLHKKRHPSKTFFVKKSEPFHRMGYPIPDVHYCEMVKSDNKVATLRALDDFVLF